MKLYFECNMGASGNMIMAALYELLPDKAAFHKKMENLSLPGVVIHCSEAIKCGVTGTHISVEIDGAREISDDVHSHAPHDHTQRHIHDHDHDHGHNHDHEHGHNHDHNRGHNHDHEHKHKAQRYGGRRYGYKEILTLIGALELSAGVKDNAIGVYEILGQAEAKAHGVSLDEIHFHEVGSIDAIVDVVGCSLLIDMLGLTEITASPIHVGYGMVRCEHGILPVPAPATAEILNGIPIYGGIIEGELCTPTGAALLKRFASGFSTMPAMAVSQIGYGMGTKDFEAANCIRAFLYEDTYDADSRGINDASDALGIRESADTRNTHDSDDTKYTQAAQKSGNIEHQDTVYEISCNLDDMTPEAIGAVYDALLGKAVLDVFATPILMKKNRPAVMLTCLCKREDCDAVSKLLISHTTTLGVRITEHKRVIMERTEMVVQTKYGNIRVKCSRGFGVTKCKPEYDDVLTAAKTHEVPFQTVYNSAYSAAGEHESLLQ